MEAKNCKHCNRLLTRADGLCPACESSKIEIARERAQKAALAKYLAAKAASSLPTSGCRICGGPVSDGGRTCGEC